MAFLFQTCPFECMFFRLELRLKQRFFRIRIGVVTVAAISMSLSSLSHVEHFVLPSLWKLSFPFLERSVRGDRERLSRHHKEACSSAVRHSAFEKSTPLIYPTNKLVTRWAKWGQYQRGSWWSWPSFNSPVQGVFEEKTKDIGKKGRVGDEMAWLKEKRLVIDSSSESEIFVQIWRHCVYKAVAVT